MNCAKCGKPAENARPLTRADATRVTKTMAKDLARLAGVSVEAAELAAQHTLAARAPKLIIECSCGNEWVE